MQDKLNETVARVTPKTRFQFKRASTGGVHVDMGAPENDPRLNPGSFARNAHAPRPAKPSKEPAESDDTVGELPKTSSTRDYNEELSKPGLLGIRKPSFSMAKNIGISNQTGLHIILPSSASQGDCVGQSDGPARLHRGYVGPDCTGEAVCRPGAQGH